MSNTDWKAELQSRLLPDEKVLATIEGVVCGISNVVELAMGFGGRGLEQISTITLTRRRLLIRSQTTYKGDELITWNQIFTISSVIDSPCKTMKVQKGIIFRNETVPYYVDLRSSDGTLVIVKAGASSSNKSTEIETILAKSDELARFIALAVNTLSTRSFDTSQSIGIQAASYHISEEARKAAAARDYDTKKTDDSTSQKQDEAN